MSKIFYDFEFLEGKQDKRFLSIKYGETKPTIDVISIGMVNENGDEYYAISKDFNLYEAWNRYEIIDYELSVKKVYWIRDNVLKPIFEENTIDRLDFPFNYKNMKSVIEIVGKTNKQIAKEVLNFIFPDYKKITTSKDPENINIHLMQNGNWVEKDYLNPQLISYYSAYDHVCFAWLFGKMIDLPKGLPMYTFDLKQEFDRRQDSRINLKKVINATSALTKHEESSLVSPLNLKEHTDYPKQENEHNALADARWNKKLYEFLKTV